MAKGIQRTVCIPLLLYQKNQNRSLHSLYVSCVVSVVVVTIQLWFICFAANVGYSRSAKEDLPVHWLAIYPEISSLSGSTKVSTVCYIF